MSSRILTIVVHLLVGIQRAVVDRATKRYTMAAVYLDTLLDVFGMGCVPASLVVFLSLDINLFDHKIGVSKLKIVLRL